MCQAWKLPFLAFPPCALEHGCSRVRPIQRDLLGFDGLDRMHRNDGFAGRDFLGKAKGDGHNAVDISPFEDHLLADVVSAGTSNILGEVVPHLPIGTRAQLPENCKADVYVCCFCLQGSLAGDVFLLPDANVHGCSSEDRDIDPLAGADHGREPNLRSVRAPILMDAADLHRPEVLLHVLELHPEDGHGILHEHIGAVDNPKAQFQFGGPLVGVLPPRALPCTWRTLAPRISYLHHAEDLPGDLDFLSFQDAIGVRRL
mmetsp:Transcript_2949/g.7035  ORF Transcript_2949/g.7035 Transcript_2949/m.7035 type:complete len:258 (-) Transcript_2949:264-1037(-)